MQEYHPDDDPKNVVNTIVAVSLSNCAIWLTSRRPDTLELVAGADFYSAPQLSPDGNSLACVHPTARTARGGGARGSHCACNAAHRSHTVC